MKAARISVVVPVRNGRALLPDLIGALETQTLPRDDFEVIVVDDGSEDHPEELFDRASRPFRVIRRVGGGNVAAARNTGWTSSTGQIVAFTDADCRPRPDWLERGVAAVADSPRVAGRIVISTGDPPTYTERLDRSRFLRQERYVREGFGATANLFVRREVLTSAGGFDERLSKYEEDAEIGRRAASFGFAIAYRDDVVVEHPSRRSPRQLLEKAIGVGYGCGRSVALHGTSLRSLTARGIDRVGLASQTNSASMEPSLAIGHLALAAATATGAVWGYFSARRR
ncbi:MAG: glycosyltransferase family 2 protein [Deltaproteobacteria bacterium]|nr:glycosyltransferase family 2 protein [Deltaproteobacteria bacterium]